jgi:hypothetical protein
MKSEKSYRASDLEVKTAADKLAKLQNRTLTNLIETLLRKIEPLGFPGKSLSA